MDEDQRWTLVPHWVRDHPLWTVGGMVFAGLLAADQVWGLFWGEPMLGVVFTDSGLAFLLSALYLLLPPAIIVAVVIIVRDQRLMREAQQGRTAEIAGLEAERDEALSRVRELEADKSPAKLPRPTESERVAIDDLRVVFRAHGVDAACRMRDVLKRFEKVVKATNPMHYFVWDPVRELEDRRFDLTDLLTDQSQAPFSAVTGAFVRFLGAYMEAVRTLHAVAGDEAYRKVSHDDYHKGWRPAHSAFAQDLRTAMNREAFSSVRERILKELGEERYGSDPVPRWIRDGSSNG